MTYKLTEGPIGETMNVKIGGGSWALRHICASGLCSGGDGEIWNACVGILAHCQRERVGTWADVWPAALLPQPAVGGGCQESQNSPGISGNTEMEKASGQNTNSTHTSTSRLFCMQRGEGPAWEDFVVCQWLAGWPGIVGAVCVSVCVLGYQEVLQKYLRAAASKPGPVSVSVYLSAIGNLANLLSALLPV